MSKSTRYIIGIALTIGVGAILQYFLCCTTGTAVENSISKQAQSSVSGLPFKLKDTEGNFSIDLNHNFDFPVSSYSFETPISQELEDGISQLKDYLNNNENVSLAITGFAYDGEENTSAFPSLGEARANAVKSALIERGINGGQMTVLGASFQEDMPSGNMIKGPVSYDLSRSGAMTGNDGMKASNDAGNNSDSDIEKELQKQPLVLHFETGRAYVNLTQEERQLISRLNHYIDQNDQARIEITGHTDNEGNPETNMRLGKERAEFLKAYLVRNGFQSDRIHTESRGETEPIASNNTANGRAVNRRAVMTIVN